MQRFGAVLVLLLGLVAAAQASSRANGFIDMVQDNVFDNYEAMKTWLNAATTGVAGEEKDEKFRVLVTYIVPPPIQLEWIEAFKTVKEATKEEEGSDVYVLTKPLSDNIKYYIYEEWDNAKAYGKHLTSEHLKKFLEYDQEKGVVFTIAVLKYIA